MHALMVLPLLAALLALTACATAASLTPAAPDELGLSPEGLDRITAGMQAHVEANRVAGCVMLLARHGRVGYLQAVGMRDCEAGAPMEPDTVFRIYSMTKPITSVALMMLWEEGLCDLDDPVASYLPELGGLQVAEPDGSGGHRLVPAKREMAVRDLMRHTSGLTYGFDPDQHVDKLYQEAGVLNSKDLAEMAAKLGKLPLKWQPGERWEYSVSVDVQGRLIEALSGMPLDRYLHERVFEPLGMVDTAFWVSEDRAGRFAALYQQNEDGTLRRATEEFCLGGPDYLTPATFFSGGGGLVSTAGDYARFAQMLLNGGELEGVRILRPETIVLMATDQLDDQPRAWLEDGGFGLGFRCNAGSAGGASAGQYGWGGAAHTRFWVDEANDMIGVWMVQIMPDNGLPYADEFTRLAYEALQD